MASIFLFKELFNRNVLVIYQATSKILNLTRRASVLDLQEDYFPFTYQLRGPF